MPFSIKECAWYNRFAEPNKNRCGLSEFPVKAKVEAKIGERSVDKLIDTVVDVFSPATELAGALGDAVRLGRVEIAAQVTKRAKVIADTNGLPLNAPPLKFLVPFYEKASLEDDAELQEIWAKLLVSASAGKKANHTRYAGILSELDRKHIEVLRKIFERHGSLDERGLDHLEDIAFTLGEREVVQSLKMIAVNAHKARSSFSNKAEICFHKFREDFDVNSIMPIIMTVVHESDNPYYDDVDFGYDDSEHEIYEALSSVGFIRKIDTDFVKVREIELSTSLYHATTFGVGFWRAVSTLSR